MHRTLIAAGDFDPMQVAIIVIFVLAGFVKWLWETWQLKREAAQREEPVDPVEQRLRDEAWRKQTGQGSSVPIPTPPQAPPVAASSWDELKKAWNELKDAARQGPATPPPLRPVQHPPRPMSQKEPLVGRGSVRATQAPPAPSPPAIAVPLTQPVPIVLQPGEKNSSPSPMLAALHNLRRDPALLRQAILMHEILGPPKALQTSSETAI